MSLPGLLISLVAGVLLGLFYFIGLWWTIGRLHGRQAALLFLSSFLVRTLVVVAGFYWVMEGRWERLLAALAGFLLARILVVRCVRNNWEK